MCVDYWYNDDNNWSRECILYKIDVNVGIIDYWFIFMKYRLI